MAAYRAGRPMRRSTTVAPAASPKSSNETQKQLSTALAYPRVVTPKIQTLSSSGTSTGCGGSETGGTFTTAPSKGKTATSCKTLGKKSVSTTTENIKWNDATTSTAKITLTLVLATATITGTVTGGHFAGDTVSGKITYKLVGKCAAKPPITKATFTGKSSA